MRIIAGKHRGRRLKSIKGNNIRPTADRVREAMFNVVAERVPEAQVLDLFSGSGALGMEALSRGAAYATFVEKNHDSINLIRANLELLGEVARSSVLKGDVWRMCEKLGREGRQFHIIFSDPPYKVDYHDTLIALILENNLVAPGGVIVYETRPDFEFKDECLESFQESKIKSYGDTKVWFLIQ